MTDPTPEEYTAFVTPESSGERTTFNGCEIHVVHHDAGTEREAHTHGEEHIIFIRSGTMRWGVDGETHETTQGDTIVTPANVPHSWEVIGDDPARVVCVTAPPEPDSEPGET
ncbi:cupin domain-containing protein [Haladaptatus pallidirubidus]|uniref:Cupin type-2 domain-containing protein n=1 Tax=Haladaptatus pallidirubidus TaxID=1008152 RepID=A0AAV3UQM1_9EURY|nr:cupin domain-containing protein [Haladaptatus pallidirubidus]